MEEPMKLILKSVLLVSIVSGTALVLTAAAPAAQDKPAPKPHDMTGCLQKGDTAGTYRLTNVEKVNTVEIVEVGKDVQKIDAHVGHRVTITGVSAPAPKEGAKGHFMRVDAFKHVAPTCP